jgi:hypothetical protein
MNEEQDDAEMDDVEHDNPSDDEELKSSIGSHDSSESYESGMDEEDEDEDASGMDDSSSEESDGDAVDEEGDWGVHYNEGCVASNGDGDQYGYEEVEGRN